MQPNNSLVSVFIASVFCADREYRRPLGINVPGRSLIAMSEDPCGGREVALALLNTAPKVQILGWNTIEL